MLANREWSQYGVKRAPLRVTIPSPGQRSTYFLQLPYAFSVPLLIASIILHWFISQSIFLARIAIYDGRLVPYKTYRGPQPWIASSGWDRFRFKGYKEPELDPFQNLFKISNVVTSIGYSDQAFIASVVWVGVVVLFLIVVANVMVYPKGAPIGGTNSAVISAACHVKHEEGVAFGGEEDDIATRPLKWGVTIRGGKDRVGHCCFSSGEVEEPVVGHLYAGRI